MAQAQLAVRQRDNEKEALASRTEALGRLREEIAAIAASRDAMSEEQKKNDDAITAKDDEIAARAGEEYRRAKQEVEDAKVALGTANNTRESKEQLAKERDDYIIQLKERIEDNLHQRSDIQNNIADTRTQLEDVRARKNKADETAKKL